MKGSLVLVRYVRARRQGRTDVRLQWWFDFSRTKPAGQWVVPVADREFGKRDRMVLSYVSPSPHWGETDPTCKARLPDALGHELIFDDDTAISIVASSPNLRSIRSPASSAKV